MQYALNYSGTRVSLDRKLKLLNFLVNSVIIFLNGNMMEQNRSTAIALKVKD